MPRPSSPPQSSRPAHPSQPGVGCLSGFFIPPLLILAGIVVVIISLAAAPSRRPPASAAASDLSPLLTPSVRAWGQNIQAWAAEAGVDPNLAAVVMQIESCGHPEVSSPAGAAGLFQVMPFHFSAGEDPLDPATNARRGLGYLKRSLDEAGGDARRALAGYNGGIGILSRVEAAWPRESIRYSSWGGRIYADIQSGAQTSPALQEWLEAGGSRLCGEAESVLGLQ